MIYPRMKPTPSSTRSSSSRNSDPNCHIRTAAKSGTQRTSASYDRDAATVPGERSTAASATPFVVTAIGPEADVKPKAFTRALRAAEDRLKDLEED